MEGTVVKKLDYDLVGEQLFSNPKVRARIERHYRLPTDAATSSQFLDYAVRHLDQEAMDNPLTQTYNLIWMLGAYLEKKNKESNVQYIHD